MFVEQTGQSIKFSAFFTASKIGKTGMVVASTLTVDVFGPAGSLVSGAACVEVGDGVYTYTLSALSTTNVGEYFAIFKTTDVTCDQFQIFDKWSVGRTWVSNMDQPVSSRSTLSAAGVWTYGTRNLTDFGLTLSTPVTTPTVNVTGGGSSGGLLQAGAYYVKYTFTNAAGETPASPESLQFTVGAGNIPQVTLPSLPSGATGYNIYLTQAAGASGTETLYKTGVTTTTTNLSIATTTGNQPPPTVNSTVDLVTKIWNANTRTLTAFGFSITVGTVNDKTGYALASNGLDQIAITDPGGIANYATWPKLLVGIWRYFYKQTTATSTVLKTYADDNLTVNTSMPLTNDGTTQTKGSAV